MESAGLSLRAGLVVGLGVLMATAHGAGSLELAATIALPEVSGRIDHFAIDREGQRLFVAALGNDTVEVIDLAANRHLRSLKGFSEPQGLIYLPQTGLLYVANGGNNAIAVVEPRSGDPIKGFIPVGWFPAALALTNAGDRLLVVARSRAVCRSHFAQHRTTLQHHVWNAEPVANFD